MNIKKFFENVFARTTKDAIYGLIKSNQTFTISNGSIVFQNIFHDIITFLRAFEPIFEALLTLIDVHPKHVFDLWGKTKRNHWVPNQEPTADDPANRCFECLKTSLLELMYCGGE